MITGVRITGVRITGVTCRISGVKQVLLWRDLTPSHQSIHGISSPVLISVFRKIDHALFMVCTLQVCYVKGFGNTQSRHVVVALAGFSPEEFVRVAL
jgi:hypothetical protein